MIHWFRWAHIWRGFRAPLGRRAAPRVAADVEVSFDGSNVEKLPFDGAGWAIFRLPNKNIAIYCSLRPTRKVDG